MVRIVSGRQAFPTPEVPQSFRAVGQMKDFRGSTALTRFDFCGIALINICVPVWLPSIASQVVDEHAVFPALA
jgi:hypothetical protein